MPRPRRIVTTDCFYHVYNRFVSGSHLFENKETVSLFITMFNESAKKFGICVYIIYCMSNHFHALIKLTEQNLSEFLQHYSTRFCRLVNRQLRRNGHLFQSRHKTQLVQTEKYLTSVVRYILNNARRAGIVERVEDYRWSNLDDILKTYQENEKYKELLEIIFEKPITKKSGQEFIEWLNSENDENMEEIKKNRQQFILVYYVS